MLCGGAGISELDPTLGTSRNQYLSKKSEECEEQHFSIWKTFYSKNYLFKNTIQMFSVLSVFFIQILICWRLRQK